jgi:hypothetical protein
MIILKLNMRFFCGRHPWGKRLWEALSGILGYLFMSPKYSEVALDTMS